MIERDSTVLPEPDSPTTPRVLPRSSENVTPSTARTMPRAVSKCGAEVGDVEQRAVERRGVEPALRGFLVLALRRPRAHSALSRTSKRARTTSPR